MKVTYLEHSGFAAEYKEYVLILTGTGEAFRNLISRKRFMYLPVTRIMIILIKKSSGGVSNIQMFGTSFQQILQEKNSQRNSRSGLYM